jgi:hypothetical protein
MIAAPIPDFGVSNSGFSVQRVMITRTWPSSMAAVGHQILRSNASGRLSGPRTLLRFGIPVLNQRDRCRGAVQHGIDEETSIRGEIVLSQRSCCTYVRSK